MNKIKTSMLVAAGLLPLAGAFAERITYSPNDGDIHLISSDQTWSASDTHILDGFVVVPDGVTLTIEAGAVVLGDTDTVNGVVVTREAENGVALIVAQGGQLIANGTAASPITFSYVGDPNVDPDATGSSSANPILDRGFWGGIILLGKATINSNGQDGDQGGPTSVGLIEGVPDVVPTIYRTYGGGESDTDSSGSLRYVSIRHTGAILGAGDEIQGLTCGGVGSGTVLEFIETFASNDDGVEFFGGTVNIKYLVVAGKRDDGLDTDQGYNGYMQFVLVYDVVSPEGEVGRGGEHDGGDGAEAASPFSLPMIANATMIGIGGDVNADTLTNDENDGVRIRDNSGVSYLNSIFTEYNGTAFRYDEDGNFNEDSRARLEAGDSEPSSNYVVGATFGDVIRNGGVDADSLVLADGDDYAEFIFTDASLNNVIGDKTLQGISRTPNGGLIPVLDDASGSIATPTPATLGGSFFTNVDFIGAFDPSATGLWTDGWTALSQLGYTPAADTDTYLDDGRTSLGNSFYITAIGGVFITPATHPWYYHAQFGWLYTGIDGNSNAAGWYYAFNPAIGDFVFIGEATWPFSYFNSESAWLFADEQNLISGANGAFFFRTDGTFINVQQ
ncbi:hypothetical protein [Rubellicoccus peritrichatus]|uniref:Uncharacterized protein n=1 Tax=Rubellicoccus peritrichatus TaxID=3080537 RepID=A0AAQ3LDT9_9BACT|nr:hypothetical protein [Puniceicoccus sp. CR14]WOO42742.1 hypothetical protein RZN69_06535 [Puniceicoccus sp. CR14]